MQHPLRALHSAFGRLAACLLAACLLAAAPLVAQNKDITLNFKDADIRQIIEAVAEATGKNFIVDSRVKGPVTLISRTPLDADTVYEVFLNVLQVNGFIAVPAGSVIKILPDTNARQIPSKDLPGALNSSSDEIVTQVIEVKNVGAAQLVPILRPLVPQYGHLAAHPASNTLIISDREANVYRLLRIIARIDQASDEDIEVIPLEHASAGDLVRVLTALNQAGARGEGAPAPSTLVADERTNSVLLGGEKSERLRYRTLIAHLDTPLETGGDTQVVYLRYADAEDLATKLKEQVTGIASQAAAGGAQGAAVPPTQQGSAIIWADAPTNSLVMTAPPKIMRTLRSVIDKLDIRRAQVKLEAFIADISLEKSMQLGFNFAVDGTDDAGSAGLTNFSSAGLGIVDLAALASGGTVSAQALSAIPDGLTLGVGKIRDGSTSFALLVNALRGDGTTNILSVPTVVTMDNEEAQLSVGQQVPFLTGSFTNTGGAGGGTGGTINPFQTIQRQDVGLTLKVTPQINEGNAVVLEINLEVSSLAQGSSGAVDLITNRRTVSQKVVVEDGGVVVLGGLIDDTLVEGEQRVPGLGRIPILGNLFKARNTKTTKRNLMVFIRPRILRDGLQAAYETNTKYEYIRNLQLEGNRNVQLMRDASRPVMPPLESIQHPDLLNPPAPTLGPVVPWAAPHEDLGRPGDAGKESGTATPGEEPEDGG